MRRGDIYVADLDAARAIETNKKRPVVIVSNDGINRAANRLDTGVVTVGPLTTDTARIYGFQVLLTAAETGLNEESKAQAEQIRAIGFSRFGSAAVGHLSDTLMQPLDTALHLHLAL